MTLINKIVITLAALAIAFAVGFFSGKSEKITVKDKIVYKDRIVTVTKTVKPDGTVVTETKTEDKTGTTTKVASKPIIPRYSAGIITSTRYDKFKFDYGISGGMRLIDNFWVKASFTPATKYTTLGIEFQL